MTELDRTWAATQVEAMADGSLSPDARRRMRALMAEDPAIAAAVDRAQAVRRDLRTLAGRRPPPGQLRRLWMIPAADRPRDGYWVPATVLATVAAVAVGVSVLLGDAGPTSEEIARDQAMQDFAIAMAYLQKSATMATNEVNEAVGYGVLDAWAIGQGAIRESVAAGAEGEQDNED